MKIRLTGTVPEVARAVEAIREVLDVREVSGQYPCRNNRSVIRVYADVRLTSTDEEGSAA